MSFHSDGSESRERSHREDTLSPEPTPRLQMHSSAAADLPSSSADTEIDLRAAVYEVLRCAFRSAGNGGAPHVTDDRTDDAVRSVCAMARANDVRAETLILAIKGGWRQLPEAHGMIRIDAEVTLAAVITKCIKEYYAPQRRL